MDFDHTVSICPFLFSSLLTISFLYKFLLIESDGIWMGWNLDGIDFVGGWICGVLMYFFSVAYF